MAGRPFALLLEILLEVCDGSIDVATVFVEPVAVMGDVSCEESFSAKAKSVRRFRSSGCGMPDEKEEPASDDDGVEERSTNKKEKKILKF